VVAGKIVVSTDTIVLAPVSASVPEARRFVADRLADLPSDTVDIARLLVSEVVTNAVLHARTDLLLTLDRSDTTVSVQVADQNPLLPVIRTHGADAGTGRGLKVLEKLASRWGTRRTENGKIVWFEIRTGGASEPPCATNDQATGTWSDSSTDAAAAAKAGDAKDDRRPGELQDPRRAKTGGAEEDPSETLVHFRWIGLPLVELDMTAQHYDAILREFHLVLEREPEARASVPGRLIGLMDELTQFGPLISSVEQDLERGRRSGAASIDVELGLPKEIGPLALRLDSLLDEADAYCAAGIELLSLEPTAEVVALRKWLIGELGHQAEGHPPVAWPDSPWATPFPQHSP
jgi:hypothetical protein